jgi:hypothetical protein
VTLVLDPFPQPKLVLRRSQEARLLLGMLMALAGGSVDCGGGMHLVEAEDVHRTVREGPFPVVVKWPSAF